MLHRKTIRNRRQSRRKNNRKRFSKRRRNFLQGGTPKCCMCGKEIGPNGHGFNPVLCLKNHGSRAHSICPNCWFFSKDAFGKEEERHDCPGCKTKFPLGPLLFNPKEVVELLDDDDDEEPVNPSLAGPPRSPLSSARPPRSLEKQEEQTPPSKRNKKS